VGKDRLPLATLSSGEKQILRILVEAIGARDSAVIIDEPELSMHVDWQRQIVSAMLVVNPHCQLILATHSPEVMAHLDDHQVFEL
jgi:predicted ATP-binding protein involved in virulence